MIVAMQGSNSVAANATLANALTGERYERPPFDAIGSLYVTGSAIGLTAELNVGGNSVTPPISVSAQNRFPLVPDDVLIQDWETEAGGLVQLTVVNTTAGALTVFWRIELEEAEMEDMA